MKTAQTPRGSIGLAPLFVLLAALLLQPGPLGGEASAQPLFDRTERPIRGVWLRPPGTMPQFETIASTMAEAGITDIYLETFYWGLTTHRSEVFRDRFSFDYLEEAIRVGSRHGVRVHAWIESAYWSFSGTGNYILNEHPEWKVVDVYSDTNIGDIPGQVFVNLGHPGVQGKLADLVAELAAYPGLAGIQSDYHRFPLDNNPGDGFPAPYSYDAWSRSEFQNEFGSDPLLTARRPTDPQWSNFVQWRRDGVSEAARVMFDAIGDVDPQVRFSAAVFAQATTSSSQLVKMQEWPAWTAGGYVDYIVPMAYATSTTGIRNDLQTTRNLAGNTRVVAGLAILTNTTRPSISQQLSTARNQGIEDFILFDANTLMANPSMRTSLRNWIDQNAMPQVGDFNRDGVIDARDREFFFSVFQGEPVPRNNQNRHMDLNNDGVIDEKDLVIFERLLLEYRYGEDGVIGQKAIDFLTSNFTPPHVIGPPDPNRPLNLHDLNGDGVVDYQDLLILHAGLTEPVEPDLDVNRDGVVDIEDLHEQAKNPIDINRDGVIDEEDTRVLVEYLRQNEQELMEQPQR
ncbi:MAG: family 10 glycosylhydrolase [Phycisphaerales bacterium]|nr:family 10 glycosylhydrolase [Phycisphaerales bacterium]